MLRCPSGVTAISEQAVGRLVSAIALENSTPAFHVLGETLPQAVVLASR